MTASQSTRSLKAGFARWLFVALGLGLTVLATIGAFLPVLPTTPFLILAAACFVGSSPALHRRLLQNRLFGRYLEGSSGFRVGRIGVR